MNKLKTTWTMLPALALLAWAALGVSPIYANSTANGATAEIKDAEGKVVGSATLTANGESGVNVQVRVQGFGAAAAGEHGIHIHAVGVCEAPQFTTAGGHFNPESKKHGRNNPEGSHAGDLPNLVMADGSALYTTVVPGISLDGSGANSIFDADGSAVVIHAGPDDMATDPAGNSGARIACGVLNAAVLPAGMPSTGSESGGSVLFWLGPAVFLLAAGLVTMRVRRNI
jgi:superoxide dismutase, Cu-Zn family